MYLQNCLCTIESLLDERLVLLLPTVSARQQAGGSTHASFSFPWVFKVEGKRKRDDPLCIAQELAADIDTSDAKFDFIFLERTRRRTSCEPFLLRFPSNLFVLLEPKHEFHTSVEELEESDSSSESHAIIGKEDKSSEKDNTNISEESVSSKFACLELLLATFISS